MSERTFDSPVFVRAAEGLIQEIACLDDAFDFLDAWPEHRRGVIYETARRAWPPDLTRHINRLATLRFVQFLFWEFFTPFNLFSEPLSLIALELVYWGIVAFVEAIAIVFAFSMSNNG